MKVFATLFSRPSVESRIESLHDRLAEVERKLNLLTAAVAIVERNRNELLEEAASIKNELAAIKVPVSMIGDIR
jgi:chromosome segregation ATPase